MGASKLNKARQKEEALKDQAFIEYLRANWDQVAADIKEARRLADLDAASFLRMDNVDGKLLHMPMTI